MHCECYHIGLEGKKIPTSFPKKDIIIIESFDTRDDQLCWMESQTFLLIFQNCRIEMSDHGKKWNFFFWSINPATTCNIDSLASFRGGLKNVGSPSEGGGPEKIFVKHFGHNSPRTFDLPGLLTNQSFLYPSNYLKDCLMLLSTYLLTDQ